MEIQNKNPQIYEIDQKVDQNRIEQERDETVADPIDSQEVFDMIRHLPDPEHPLTLE